MSKSIIVAITGASGSQYAISLLTLLKAVDCKTHLVISEAAQLTISYETNYSLADVRKLADKYYDNDDTAAAIASGSFITDGMIVVPCSVKTMSAIAYGITDSLIARASDVILKERRRLVLVTRETPLHSGHLETMLKLSNMGAIIAPPLPALYLKPQSVDDIINNSMCRVLDLLGVSHPASKRWTGDI